MPYTEFDLAQMADATAEWLERADALSTALLLRHFQTQRAHEFVRHGFLRRLNMLQHTHQRIFEHVPPTELNPGREALMDATVHLHAFFTNVFGAIDNLAHIWVLEAGVVRKNGQPFSKTDIGFSAGQKMVRDSLPESLTEKEVG